MTPYDPHINTNNNEFFFQFANSSLPVEFCGPPINNYSIMISNDLWFVYDATSSGVLVVSTCEQANCKSITYAHIW